MMKLGLQIPTFDFPDTPDDRLFDRVADVARAAEEVGFDSIWVMDHLFQITQRPSDPIFEGYTLLSGLAARTSRVKLGTLVTGVTYRNPALLAKMVTSLDVISAGRAICGIGAAWFELEHRGLGYVFPPVGERMDRLEEAVQICRLMFTEEAPSFEGRHYTIREALNRPRPVTPGGPPIMIGGSGEKRTLKLVARYADACNLFGEAEVLKHKLAVLDEHCAAVGRDPRAITRTNLRTVAIAPTEAEVERTLDLHAARWGEGARARAVAGTPDRVADEMRALVDAGLDGVIVNLPDAWNLETVALAGETLKGVVGSPR